MPLGGLVSAARTGAITGAANVGRAALGRFGTGVAGATWGAAAGAGHGMFSQDTSMIGGALGGAAMGGLAGGPAFRMGRSAFRYAMKPSKMGLGELMRGSAKIEGARAAANARAAGDYIGNTITKAFNRL